MTTYKIVICASGYVITTHDDLPAQQLSINHNDLKAFMSRPIGVYPSVAKKFYRQQWR